MGLEIFTYIISFGIGLLIGTILMYLTKNTPKSRKVKQ